MVGWPHQLNEYEFEQAPGVGDGQGSLECCSLGSQRVGHDRATELNLVTEAKIMCQTSSGREGHHLLPL